MKKSKDLPGGFRIVREEFHGDHIIKIKHNGSTLCLTTDAFWDLAVDFVTPEEARDAERLRAERRKHPPPDMDPQDKPC